MSLHIGSQVSYWGTGWGMSFNKCFPVDGSFRSQQDYQIVSAAGPVFTLLQAIFIFILMKYRHRKLLYPFLFICFYMRFFAMIISVINPNDETRISKWLGIGIFTFPVIMSASIFLLLYYISKQYGFDMKFNLITLGLVIFFSSVIILSDQYFQIRLL